MFRGVTFVICVHRCERKSCNGLLRPHVVWFGETLDSDILTSVEQELEKCDLCLVVSIYQLIKAMFLMKPSELST